MGAAGMIFKLTSRGDLSHNSELKMTTQAAALSFDELSSVPWIRCWKMCSSAQILLNIILC